MQAAMMGTLFDVLIGLSHVFVQGSSYIRRTTKVYASGSNFQLFLCGRSGTVNFHPLLNMKYFKGFGVRRE